MVRRQAENARRGEKIETIQASDSHLRTGWFVTVFLFSGPERFPLQTSPRMKATASHPAAPLV
jgi:hypothetical protein